jgi:hypothetical protein
MRLLRGVVLLVLGLPGAAYGVQVRPERIAR